MGARSGGAAWHMRERKEVQEVVCWEVAAALRKEDWGRGVGSKREGGRDLSICRNLACQAHSFESDSYSLGSHASRCHRPAAAGPSGPHPSGPGRIRVRVRAIKPGLA